MSTTALPKHWEEIPNLFQAKLEGFRCFGCSSNNKQGLNLKFYRSFKPGEERTTYCIVPPVGEDKSSFPTIVHGGIVSSILDDSAYWCLFHNYKVLAFTTQMNLKFLRPMFTNKKYVSVSHIHSVNDQPFNTIQDEVTADNLINKLVKVSVKIVEDEEGGKALVAGDVQFLVVPYEKFATINPSFPNILSNL